jgi:hypothetical protein
VNDVGVQPFLNLYTTNKVLGLLSIPRYTPVPWIEDNTIYSALGLFSRDEILTPTPVRDIRYTGQLSRRDLSADTCPRHPLYWPARPPLPCSAQDRTWYTNVYKSSPIDFSQSQPNGHESHNALDIISYTRVYVFSVVTSHWFISLCPQSCSRT